MGGGNELYNSCIIKSLPPVVFSPRPCRCRLHGVASSGAASASSSSTSICTCRAPATEINNRAQVLSEPVARLRGEGFGGAQKGGLHLEGGVSHKKNCRNFESIDSKIGNNSRFCGRRMDSSLDR